MNAPVAKPEESKLPTNEAPWGDWGKLGPAMRNLRTDKQRRFVFYFCHLNTGKRSAPQTAYELAGYKPGEKDLRNAPYKLLHQEEIVEAVIEESKKALRSGAPYAVMALHRLIDDPTQKDHARAIAVLLDRTDPIMTKHDMQVVHEHKVTLSTDEESLEQYKAMLALGVTQEKLKAVFGGNYLPKLQRMLEDKTKTIDHEESSNE